MKKAVIFDMDGTLLNTLEDLYLSTNAALARYGYPERTLEEVRQFVGNGAYNLMCRAVPGGEEDPRLGDCLNAFEEHYGRHLNDHTGPYEGIPELLEKLRQKEIPMAIVSNKPDFAVRELGRKYFGLLIPVTIGESRGIRRKPAPDTVEQAARELGVQLKDCIYVGDSEVDKKTADNAGLPCISVDWGFRDREELEKLGPAYLISRPEELLEILC